MHHYTISSGTLVAFIILEIVGELLLKGYALWRSSRNSQPVWFVIIFIVNTAGLLPLLYLLLNWNKQSAKR